MSHEIEIIDSSATVEALTRGEVDMQVRTAKQYPRSIEAFTQNARTLALKNREVAGSCFYSIPRAGKLIEGPSARLAEIVATCWGNLRAETRIVGTDGKFITAQATCWDMEHNVLIRTEVRRRITDKSGRTFSDDMIVVTGNAAASIALRNAVFKVVPFSHVQSIYDEAKRVSVGEGLTLEQTRSNMIGWFAKVGVAEAQLLGHLGRASVSEVTLSDCVQLRGIATAIQDGEVQASEVFPSQTPQDGLHAFGAGKTSSNPTESPGDAQRAPESVSQDASKPPVEVIEATPRVGVKDAKEAVRAAPSHDALDVLAEGEDRKTVIRAIEARREELGPRPEEPGLVARVAAAREARTVEELMRLHDGEPAKEVLDAIQARLVELNRVQTPAGPPEPQGGFGFDG